MSGFLGETRQVSGVAGQQNGRPRLGKRDNGEERVEGAPVTRQPGAPEQLARSAALLLINRDHCHSAEHTVHASVPGRAAEDLGESRRGRHDAATPPSGSLEAASGLRVTASQLDETFGIEDQGAGYRSL
jgi:hypothetical protein